MNGVDFDPNEAPPGLIARIGSDCENCAFYEKTEYCRAANCLPDQRKDGCGVIFVKPETPVEDWWSHPAIVDGTIYYHEGKFWFDCCVCGKRSELGCNLRDVVGGDFKEYGGCSERCIP